MAYINKVQINSGDPYLIEPTLFAVAGGTSTALTASINDFALIGGAFVSIMVGTVGDNATLNVNDTGAKTIYYNNTAITSGVLTQNHIYTFIFNGDHWNVVGDIAGSNVMLNTTSGWASNLGYVAPSGTIMVFTDRGSYLSNGNTIVVPGIKISDGLTYATDLPFVGDDVAAAIRSELSSHINNTTVHITNEERLFWNNKLNCDLTGETLELNKL